MKRLASSIALCSLLLFCACGSAVDDFDRNDDRTLLVNLDISVALSDVAETPTRAAEGAAAANDNEKMHTLRVIIVRPNWTVEANRLIDLSSDATTHHRETDPFPVVGNERKLVYLFVNEGTQAIDKITNLPRNLLEFDLNRIEIGGLFPATAVEGLKIRLEDDTEQIEGPLPMSERHEYFVTEDEEQSHTFFVTRAAVKFSFRIINDSSKSITIDRLTIDKMAREEWYMPRAKYGEPDAETGQREIIEYEVPAGMGYYTYGEKQTFAGAVRINAGGETVLDPIYLLEGKYTDEKDARNYSMKISVNNYERKHYFPQLETLPRNTHVLVTITCDADAAVGCTVDVIPYSEVPLDPSFGL